MTDSTRKPRSRTRGEAVTIRRIVTVASWFSVALASTIAMRIWRMTRRYPVPDRELKWLEDARSEFLGRGKQTICFRRWGDASRPAVLLVHGWAGRGSQMGAFAQPLLERGYSVVAPDLPGHGDSAGRSTDVFECAAALRELCAQSGGFAGVIAHSFGAVVVSYGLNNGLQTNCCVLVGAPSAGRRIFAGYTNWLAPPQAVVARMHQHLRDRYGDNVFEILSPGLQARELETPCLVLHDEGDRDVPIEAGIEIAANWSGARLERSSGLGHRRILRDSGIVQRAAEFVAETDAELSSPLCSQSRHSSNSER